MSIIQLTDCWRGIIGEEFTFQNLRSIAQAVADYLREADHLSGVVVGYDTRFMSEHHARAISNVLTANGIPVYLTCQPTFTPAVALAVRHHRLATGIMVTAGNLPYTYNGLKLKGANGGPITRKTAEEIRARFNARPVEMQGRKELLTLFDPAALYGHHLQTLIDFDCLRKSGIKVAVDAMYSAGGAWLAGLLQAQGIPCQLLRADADPWFGHGAPDPEGQKLEQLEYAVLSRGCDLGLAIDGDGERFGIVDRDGGIVSATGIFCLLLGYLCEGRGWEGAVVKTFAASQLIDRMARWYGLPLYESRCGFISLAEIMAQEGYLIGGDEYGKIAFQHHFPGSDAILAGLLVMEALTKTGLSLAEMLEELKEQIGSYHYRRLDLLVSGSHAQAVIEALSKDPPRSLGGCRTVAVQGLDGVKLWLEKNNWVLFRQEEKGGLRLYAEAETAQTLNQIVTAAKEIVIG